SVAFAPQVYLRWEKVITNDATPRPSVTIHEITRNTLNSNYISSWIRENGSCDLVDRDTLDAAM
ncbi:MAG TPA: hypothetical protein VJ180_09835, partial [Pyrinomonadaceae bacterium]|nr:hypothetical protein [Pyrinomonadaceae bacterium]